MEGAPPPISPVTEASAGGLHFTFDHMLTQLCAQFR